MARKKKARAKTRTKVITKTKRVYVGAKRKFRRARRAASERMSPVDIALAVGGAGVGSIGGSILLSKMPDAIPDVAKNGVLAAVGGFVAYKGLKRKNKLLIGLGMGAAAAGATNLIGSIVSGSTTLSGCAPLAAPYATLAAPYSTVAAPAPSATLAAPLAGLYDGEEM